MEGIPKYLIRSYVLVITDIENVQGYEYEVGSKKEFCQQSDE